VLLCCSSAVLQCGRQSAARASVESPGHRSGVRRSAFAHVALCTLHCATRTQSAAHCQRAAPLLARQAGRPTNSLIGPGLPPGPPGTSALGGQRASGPNLQRGSGAARRGRRCETGAERSPRAGLRFRAGRAAKRALGKLRRDLRRQERPHTSADCLSLGHCWPVATRSGPSELASGWPLICMHAAPARR